MVLDPQAAQKIIYSHLSDAKVVLCVNYSNGLFECAAVFFYRVYLEALTVLSDDTVEILHL